MYIYILYYIILYYIILYYIILYYIILYYIILYIYICILYIYLLWSICVCIFICLLYIIIPTKYYLSVFDNGLLDFFNDPLQDYKSIIIDDPRWYPFVDSSWWLFLEGCSQTCKSWCWCWVDGIGHVQTCGFFSNCGSVAAPGRKKICNWGKLVSFRASTKELWWWSWGTIFFGDSLKRARWGPEDFGIFRLIFWFGGLEIELSSEEVIKECLSCVASRLLEVVITWFLH